MQNFLIGSLVFFVGTTGLLLIMRVARKLEHKGVVGAMQADFDQLEADIRAKCEAEGELAFASGTLISGNPYLPENTDQPYRKFAGYWAFGYALAAEKAVAGK